MAVRKVTGKGSDDDEVVFYNTDPPARHGLDLACQILLTKK